MTKPFPRGLTILAVSVVVMLGVAQAPAHAAAGDLWFVRTIAAAITGAVPIGPVNPLGTASASAVSPDGTSVYVVSRGNGSGTVPGSLSHFRRAADGTLTFAGCIGLMAGCRPLDSSDLSLYDTQDVLALNNKVYLVTPWYLLDFDRASNGDLDYHWCFSYWWSDPCTYTPSLISADSVAANSTGSDVYVLSDFSNSLTGAVSHFHWNDKLGGVSFAGCISDGRPGCTATAVLNTLKYGTDLAVSHDGGSVYVTANHPGSVAHFRRDRLSGSLAFAGCVGRPVAGIPLSGCTDPGNDSLYRARRITVAPVSDSLYVAGSTVTHLWRNGVTGDIGFAGCLGSTAGCRPEVPSLDFPEIVAAMDGKSVYVTSSRADAGLVMHLRRDRATGDIAFAGCLGENTSGWCVGLPVTTAMWQLTSITASPDATNLYVPSGTLTGALTQFNRVTP